MHVSYQQWLATSFGGPEALTLVDGELADPGPGEVRVDVHACGMNPADYKHFASGQDPSLLPLGIGYEASGVVAAVGPAAEHDGHHDSRLAGGEEVIVFQTDHAWATQLVVSVRDVFLKPPAMSHAAAANLLLVGTTAAELLAAARVTEADTVLLHGAAGAVGTSVLQQARRLGATVVGTAKVADFDVVRGYGGIPVEYGPGLSDRVRAAMPASITVALDTVGSDEAVDVSLELLSDRERLVSVAAFSRERDGVRLLGAGNPASASFRAAARQRIVDLAAAGELDVPVAATYSFTEAPSAVHALIGPHPSGKLALIVVADA